jgi:hypothetical protein
MVDLSRRPPEAGEMDFVERAAVRLNHWIAHNDSHQEEYERFAAELEEAGKRVSARQIREMVALSKRSNECLRRALEALEG